MYPNSIACSDPEECEKICENAKGCTNIAYAELVLKMLQPGKITAHIVLEKFFTIQFV